MLVKVDRCFSHSDDFTVWALIFKHRGQVKIWRIRTQSPDWNRKAASIALDTFEAEGFRNRKSIRFSVR